VVLPGGFQGATAALNNAGDGAPLTTKPPDLPMLVDVIDDVNFENKLLASVFSRQWTLCDGSLYEPTPEAQQLQITVDHHTQLRGQQQQPSTCHSSASVAAAAGARRIASGSPVPANSNRSARSRHAHREHSASPPPCSSVRLSFPQPQRQSPQCLRQRHTHHVRASTPQQICGSPPPSPPRSPPGRYDLPTAPWQTLPRQTLHSAPQLNRSAMTSSAELFNPLPDLSDFRPPPPTPAASRHGSLFASQPGSALRRAAFQY